MPEEGKPKSDGTDPEPNARVELYVPPSVIESYKAQQAKSHGLEKRRFAVEILTFLAIVAYAIIAYYQWSSLREATQASKKSADAATSAARIAGDTLKSGNESSKNILAEMGKQSAAMQKAADAAKNQADTSTRALNATIAQSRLDQRAWLGTPFTIEPEFRDSGKRVYLKVGERPNFAVQIANSGKSIARNVTVQVDFKIIGRQEPFAPTYRVPIPGSSVTVLLPGAHVSIGTGVIPAATTQNEVDDIVSGSKVLYVYGSIVYEDIFRESHHSNFCLHLDPKLTNFAVCPTYNDAD